MHIIPVQQTLPLQYQRVRVRLIRKIKVVTKEKPVPFVDTERYVDRDKAVSKCLMKLQWIKKQYDAQQLETNKKLLDGMRTGINFVLKEIL